MRSTRTDAFWQAFARYNGINHSDYQATQFRVESRTADRLVAMMEAGLLRALTSPLHIFGEGRCEPLPVSGKYAVLVDQRRRPRLVLRATDVNLGPLALVTDAHVWRSGTESGEREDWLASMSGDFTSMARQHGFEMHQGIETVFETIEVVWPLEAARRIRLITPHLDRGVAILQRLRKQRAITDGLEGVLGRIQTAVLTLGSNLLVGYTNSAAEALLRRGDGLRLKNGYLTARWPADDRRLAAAASAACRLGGSVQCSGVAQPSGGAGALIPVYRDDGLAPYRVSVFPLCRERRERGPASTSEIVIFVDDPIEDAAPSQAALLSKAFWLTAAEARLAVHLGSGAALKDYAESSGVTYNTVRAQLRAIFEKTETHRQADLVRLLHNTRSLRISLS